MSVPSAITVAIATTGTSKWLGPLLCALDQQEIQHVIVVANGPRADSVPNELPGGPRVLRQAAASLSRARNAALRAAATEVLAFVDDDAVPERGWASQLAGAFGREPQMVAAGGPSLLAPGLKLPPWLGREGLGYLGILDLGPTAFVCRLWQYPYGCNFAVRRAAALDQGGFREDLGYQGGDLVPNEETELCRRFQSGGSEVHYLPQAAVVHHIDVRRLSWRYLLRRAFAQGRADARVASLHPDMPLRGGGRAAVAARWIAATAYRFVRGDLDLAGDHLLRVACLVGTRRGLRFESRRRG